MIDPDVRQVDSRSGDDLAQLTLLEREARAALVGERGGDRWLVEHPEVGLDWPDRCQADGVDVLVAHIGEVVVGYLVGVLGDDRIIRVDQVWVTPLARRTASVMRCSHSRSNVPRPTAQSPSRASRCRGIGTRRTSTSEPGSWPGSSPPIANSDRQRPVHCGARFSMNAVRPSFRSSDDITAPIAEFVIFLSVSSSS